MSGIVLCHGIFDVLHPHHIEHLAEARTFGAKLVVSILADAFILKPGRPIFNESQRMLMLSALRMVDIVYITREPTAARAIYSITPAIFVPGIDYLKSGICVAEEEACIEVGARIMRTTAKRNGVDQVVILDRVLVAAAQQTRKLVW